MRGMFLFFSLSSVARAEKVILKHMKRRENLAVWYNYFQGKLACACGCSTAMHCLQVPREDAFFTSVKKDSGLTTSYNTQIATFVTPYHHARLSSAEVTFSGPHACLKQK